MKYFVSQLIRLVPRKRNRIVYGGSLDLFIDNAKHLFILNNEQMPDVHHIWLSNNKNTLHQVQALGFCAVRSKSLKGLYLMLTARMIIFDNMINDFSYHTLSSGAIRLELWHGVPYCKHIGISRTDNPVPFQRKLAQRFNYMDEHLHGDICISPSEKARVIFSASFCIPIESIILSDYPRCRFLYMTSEEINNFVKQYEPISTQRLFSSINSETRKKVLYMPTFRDADPNYISKAIPNWAEFNEFLESNDILIYLKVHRMTPIPHMSYSNIIILDNALDVYPIMPLFDMLITDYSSIMYEFALLHKPIVLYTFDMDLYIKYSRNIYSSFINQLKELSNVSDYKSLEYILSSPGKSIKPFPTDTYFDFANHIENLILFIKDNTSVS